MHPSAKNPHTTLINNATLLKHATNIGSDFVNNFVLSSFLESQVSVSLEYAEIGDEKGELIEDPDLALKGYNELLKASAISIVGPTISKSFEKFFHNMSLPILSTAPSSKLRTGHFFVGMDAVSVIICNAMVETLYVLGERDVMIIVDENDEYASDALFDCKNRLKDMNVIHSIFEWRSDFSDTQTKNLFSQMKMKDTKNIMFLPSHDVTYNDFVRFFTLVRSTSFDKGYYWFLSNVFARTMYSQENKEDTNIFQGIIFAQKHDSFFSKKDYYYTRMKEYMGHIYHPNVEFYKVYFDSILVIGYTLQYLLENSFEINAENMLRFIGRTNIIGAEGNVKFYQHRTCKSTEKRIIVRMKNIGNNINDIHRTILEWDLKDLFEWKISNSSHIIFPGNIHKSQLKLGKQIPRLGNKWISIPEYSISPQTSYGYCSWCSGNKYFLHGGFDGRDYYNELYVFELDNGKWIRVESTNGALPEPRKYHSCFIYNDNFFIFGGQADDDILDDFWVYSIRSKIWTQFYPTNNEWPIARFGHRFEYQKTIKHVFLFGGAGEYKQLSDMYVWNFKTNLFHKVDKNINNREYPSPRSFYSMMENTKGIIFVFGGITNNIDPQTGTTKLKSSNELWSYNITCNTWKLLTTKNVILPRHANGYAGVDDWFYILDGQSSEQSESLSQFLRLDLSADEKDMEWVAVECKQLDEFKARSDFYITRYDQSFLIFGGRNQLEHPHIENELSDFWVYDLQLRELSLVHESYYSPHPFSRHSSMIIGTELISFGGLTWRESQLEETNNVFAFDLENILWRPVEITSHERPPPIQRFCYCNVGKVMYIYGGFEEELIYNSFWKFSPLLNTFKAIESRNEIDIGPRFDCSLTYNNKDKLVLFGGETYESQLYLYSYYKFDVNRRIWEERRFNFTNYSPIGLSSCSSIIIGEFLYSIGCSRFRMIERQILKINLESGLIEKHLEIPEKLLSTHNSLIKMTDNIVFIFGGADKLGYSTNLLYKIDLHKKIVMEIINDYNWYPLPRKYHSCNYYQNQIVCLGGLEGKLYEDVNFENLHYALPEKYYITPNIWAFFLNDVDEFDITCAPGSFWSKKDNLCFNCGTGLYSDDGKTCKKCPVGFYSNIVGIRSKRNCLPCKTGYYNDVEGSSSCKKCSDGKYCPIASFEERDKDDEMEDITYFKSEHPEYFDPPLQTIAYISLITNSTIVMIWLICFCVLYLLWRVGFIKMELLLCLDCLLKEEHHHEGENEFGPEPKIEKQTVCGGLFSVIAVILIIIFLTTSVTLYFTGWSDEETKSLFISSLDEGHHFDATFRFKVSLHNYRANCVKKSDSHECDDLIRVNTYGVRYGSEKIQCDKTAEFTCEVSYEIDSTTVEEMESSVAFNIETPGSFTVKYVFEIESTTGYQFDTSQTCVLNGAIVSSQDTLFRGVIPSTIVNLKLYETEYEQKGIFSHDRNTGYHFDITSHSVGNEVHFDDFSEENGMVLEFKFDKSENMLKIEREKEESVITFFPELFAGVIGVMELIYLFSFIFEYVYTFFGFRNDITEKESIEKEKRLKNWKHVGKDIKHKWKLLTDIKYKTVVTKYFQPIKRSLRPKEIEKEEYEEIVEEEDETKEIFKL